MSAGARPGTAFVLGGGGVLGASEVGMLRALAESGRRPDLVVGTSVGALNGAMVAADPTPAGIERLTLLWASLAGRDVFGPGGLGRLRQAVRSGTHLHSTIPLRTLIESYLGPVDIADLPVPFQCCAASIERAAETWFASGPLAEAVTASCAVPGLFAPVRIGSEHYLDGGLVNSIPVGRAVQLGAGTVFVLQVGRIEQPLEVPRRPWEVATVAFEVARRHRFARDMADLPQGVTVHVLPTGGESSPTANLRYRATTGIGRRIDRAHAATAEYLADLPADLPADPPAAPPARPGGRPAPAGQRNGG